MTKRKPLSWKAVRRGQIYCAPACGFNCTFAAFQKATIAAEKLAKQVKVGDVLHEVSTDRSNIRGLPGRRGSRPIYILEISEDRRLFTVGWNTPTQIRRYGWSRIRKLQKLEYRPREPKKKAQP